MEIQTRPEFVEVYRFGRHGLIAGIESWEMGGILQGVEWRGRRVRRARTELCGTLMFEAQEERVKQPERWEEAQGQIEETVWRQGY